MFKITNFQKFQNLPKFFYKIFRNVNFFKNDKTYDSQIKNKISIFFFEKIKISKLGYEWATIRYEKLYIYKQKLLFFINTNIYKNRKN